MARIVYGAGVPHTPYFPTQVEREGPGSRTGGLFARTRADLEAARPDLILMLTSDHFVNFFYDKMPAFCVSTADEAEGPHELSRDMPWYTVKLDGAFGSALLDHGLQQGFDLAAAGELKLDHSSLVPLHFMTPKMDVPMVVVYVNGLATPIPVAPRAYELGRMIGRFVDQWPDDRRVAVIASGSFSLEVGGPTMGYVDQDWIATVVSLMQSGAAGELVSRSTRQQLKSVGNTGGEMLNWIALLGAVGDRPPTWIEADVQPPDSPRDGHGYAVWRLDEA